MSAPYFETSPKFEPFVGIAPRVYMTLFTMLKRKNDQGQVLPWSKVLRLEGFPALYLRNEKEALSIFEETQTTNQERTQ